METNSGRETSSFGVWSRGDPEFQKALTAAAFKENVLSRLAILQADRYVPAREKMDRGEILNSREAALVAEIESGAALAYLHTVASGLPLDYMIRTTAFYRQVTFLRAVGAIKEEALEGDTLLLGCGTIVADTFPLCVEITPENLRLASGKSTSAIKIPAGILSDSLKVDRILVRPRSSRIVATDTDRERIRYGQAWCQSLGLVVETHVQPALRFLSQVEGKFNLILAIRLDPAMVRRGKTRFVKALATKMRARMKPEGQALITIGSGNTGVIPEELQERQAALRRIKGQFQGWCPVLHVVNAETPGCEWWDDDAYMEIESLIINSGVSLIKD